MVLGCKWTGGPTGREVSVCGGDVRQAERETLPTEDSDLLQMPDLQVTVGMTVRRMVPVRIILSVKGKTGAHQGLPAHWASRPWSSPGFASLRGAACRHPHTVNVSTVSI